MSIKDTENTQSEAGVTAADTTVAPREEAPEESYGKQGHHDPIKSREEKMRALTEKRKEGVEQEREIAANMGTLAREDVPEEAPVEEPEIETPAIEEPPKRQLMVNGQVVELSEQEYERHLQMDLAGQEKLREAAQQKVALEAYEQKLREREAALPPPEAPGDAAPIREKVKDALDNLLQGDPDVAVDELVAAIQGRQSSTPNMDAIVETVTTRVSDSLSEKENAYLVAKQKEEEASAFKDFQDEYDEIYSDPVLLAATDAKVKSLYAENPSRPVLEYFMEAGEDIRGRFGTKPRETEDNAVDLAEKREAKANLKPIPTARTTAAPETVKDEIDMSPQAKVARMRARRARG